MWGRIQRQSYERLVLWSISPNMETERFPGLQLERLSELSRSNAAFTGTRAELIPCCCFLLEELKPQNLLHDRNDSPPSQDSVWAFYQSSAGLQLKQQLLQTTQLHNTVKKNVSWRLVFNKCPRFHAPTSAAVFRANKLTGAVWERWKQKVSRSLQRGETLSYHCSHAGQQQQLALLSNS